MRKTRANCAVIGGGVTGLAAAYALAKRGAKVTLFEQFEFGHELGSSHGPTRLFRTAHFEHDDYVPLLKRAAALWRNLEAECATPLLNLCGVLMAGRPDAELIAGTLRAAGQHNLPIERLTQTHVRERFSWLSLDDDMDAFIEPEAGFLHASLACAAFAHCARQRRAAVREDTPVLSWRKMGSQIELETKTGAFSFDRVVMAPGAYASGLLGRAGALVRPMRKALFWTAPGDDRHRFSNGFIPFGVEEQDGRFYYGFPAIDEDGVKLGEHTGGAWVSAAEDGAPEAAQLAREDAEAFMRRRTPGLSPAISKQQSCLYEMSPDGHFIIDKHPDCEEISFAIGLSGHGFKFAPVLGEALTDLALNGETHPELDFLKASRFSYA
ncbi:N-methyl-L-tryptophan oxidase [Hyphococcus sp.]|uniref:N-methyl-L-tryptophan oxidase n=1 Tax=Hyphococcus sp. TaxID=2038636 RepID=UPI002088417B|nr:MAG: N-methyltryptophan oxidase [Marinicaulis sp.]